jgi:[CysO sulfur-carrier protein]-S-L-cysteine hydrolase
MLRIQRKVVDDIIAHARRESPLEACGYLAEQDGIVARHYPLTNADASEEHYSLLPEEQFAAVRGMREAGMKLRAIYHSHPATKARPSEEDIRLAYDPKISYVIVSLSGTEETVKSFRIAGAAVTPEDMDIL